MTRPPTKTTVQIVALDGAAETHVRKLTLSLDPELVLRKILELFDGHLVTRKKKVETTAICAPKERTKGVK